MNSFNGYKIGKTVPLLKEVKKILSLHNISMLFYLLFLLCIIEAAQIMYGICLAVKHLHDINIAHRDLKPENLLYSKLGKYNDNNVKKIMEFFT